MKEIKKIKLKDIGSLCLSALAFLPSIIFRRRRKHLWLACERFDVADDNSWIFYHWVRKNHPEINIYFVLDKTAANFDPSDPNMIAWGSLKHYILYFASRLYVMDTFHTPNPDMRVCSHLDKICHRTYQKVYLRHGIATHGMERHSYAVHHFRLFFCGARPEYDFIFSTSDYPKDNLKYTGLARFDDLLENSIPGDFILLIPTWRKYIGCDLTRSKEENEKAFLESEYYHRYQSLMRNPELISFLKANNLKLRFCIHAEYRRFAKFFVSDRPEVEIVGLEESIHELLINMGMLVTDYSSVFFDAAFTGKPLVYYQFDCQEFRQKHLSEGYFDFHGDGMGPVVNDEKQLLEAIKACYVDGRFVQSSEYVERCKRFFPLRDTRNCERIFNEISCIEGQQ